MLEQVKKMMGMGDDFAPAEKKVEEPPKETCKNCAEVCTKPLRCGTCKAATYCSTKCQREDWQFHKRVCKKPEAATKPDGSPQAMPNVAEKATAQGKDEKSGAAPLRPKASDSEVVKGEDVGTWYNHRDWKPQEEKKEFVPQQVTSGASGKVPTSASEWNAAGTWEERSMLPWWKEKLGTLGRLKVDKLGGTSRFLRVEKVEGVTGEANIMQIRGTPRFFFDLRFIVHFSYGYPTSSRTSAGTVTVTEFTNDLAVSDEPFPTQVSAASDSDRSQVEADLVPKIQAVLRDCIKEYETQVESRNAAAFPGQLPPRAS